ncbi:hypothetical protein EMIT019CA3_60034 [Bacillus pseudomycoides]
MSSPAFICIVLTTYYLQKEGDAIHKKSAHPIRETAKKRFFLGEREEMRGDPLLCSYPRLICQ